MILTPYDVGNVWVTCLGKTWGDSSGVRIQAYVGEGNKLHRGAELPVPDKATAYDIIAALTAALTLKDGERKWNIPPMLISIESHS